MPNVILDTNALLMPFQFSLNLDEEIKRLVGSPNIYVPSSVMNELKGLNEKAPLQLSKKYEKIEVNSSGDDGVLEAADELNAMIVTNDKELKNRALEQNIPVAYLRSKSHLELEGEDYFLTRIEDDDQQKKRIELEGKVVSGVEEARYFLALIGYKKRFREKLGFEPFEGTLNVKLEGEDLEKYEKIKEKEGIFIEGFVEKGQNFGSVECYPANIDGVDSYLIIPQKSRYSSQAEIISKDKLRDELDLNDGDKIVLEVKA